MKIAMGKLNFDTTKELIEYLEATYEKDKLIPEEINLRLEGDELEAENINELVQFLLSPAHVHVYQLKLDAPCNTKYQLALDNAYLSAKRQRFTRNVQHDMEHLVSAPISFRPHVHQIRKSKKNWVEETQGARVSLQVQPRQQQEKKQQQQKATKRKHKNKEHLAVDLIAPIKRVPSEELGELVDSSTIHAQFNSIASEHFKEKASDLLGVWDALVGADAAKIHEFDRKITHVQHVAMEKILQNYPEFSFGLVLDNLPTGFYLQQTDDDKNVLCYSSEPKFQHLDTITPLTLTLDSLRSEKDFVLGSSQQFIKDLSHSERYETEFTYLFSSTTSKQERKEALVFFLNELESNEPKKVLIKQLLNFLPLTDLNYKGLAHVLVHSGIDGVLLLLQQFKILHENEFLSDLNQLFLDDPHNYIALATDKGLQNLKKLSGLTQEQKTWWTSLVKQHKASGAITNFNDLFAAYEYFLTQLHKKELKLPLSCPLEKIRHMKPALERVLFIITHSADPEEQLAYLEGLDYGPQGAYFACRYNDYKFVSQRMKLTSKHVNAPTLNYSIEHSGNNAFSSITSQSKYEDSVTQFYRCIGEQDGAFSLDVYQKIEARITDDTFGKTQDLPGIKSQLLSLVAMAATGQRGCLNTEDPYDCFNSLLEKFVAAAHSLDPDPKSGVGLNAIIASCSAALNQCSRAKPTLEELNKLWDILLLNQDNKGEISKKLRNEAGIFMIHALNLIDSYDSIAPLFIDNYMKRFIVEQSKTTEIRACDFSGLLNHVSSSSRFGNSLPDLFKDHPESLPQFILLLSLLNDTVTPVSQPAETLDSEFETRIKNLAQALLLLKPDYQVLLLAILTDINIDASYSLPSLEQLITIVQLVKADENLLNTIDIEHQKSKILETVTTQLPETKIGNAPLDESINDLFDLLKMDLDELKLEQELSRVPEILHDKLSPLISAHQVVMQLLEKKPIDQEDVLEAVIKEDEEIVTLLEAFDNFESLGLLIPQIKIALARKLCNIHEEVADKDVDLELINKFFETKSIGVLLKPRIKESYSTTISNAIKSLHTANKDFDAFIMGQIPEFDADLFVDEALYESNEQVDEINSFIKELICIKNKNPVDFRWCINHLAEQIKPLPDKKIALSLAQMTSLLKVLNQPNTDLVAAPLEMLFTVMREYPDCPAERLENALSQLTHLSQYRKELDPEAYNILLRFSFMHHLSLDSSFPLDQLMQFKMLIGVNKEKSVALFTALIEVIKKIDPNSSVKMDDRLLKAVIEKTNSIIQAKATHNPELVPLLTSLIKTCRTSSVAELVRYYSLVNKLEFADGPIFAHWIKILTAFSRTVSDENVPLLLKVHAGLEVQQFYLNDIVSLFDYPPYPELNSFIAMLEGHSKDVLSYIENFDRDPKAGRVLPLNKLGRPTKTAEQVVEEQFDTSQLIPVIENIKSSVNGASLSNQEQHDLTQQITYINAIGKDYPLVIKEAGTEPECIKTYRDLTRISRLELRHISDYLIAELRRPGFSAADKLKAQLRLVAVLREQYFRATGSFADTTQLIAVLTSLKNQSHTMLMEIDNEGMNFTGALLAVMQWVNADGGTVDVCTANRDLVVQDYNDKGNREFFTSLGIMSSRIEEHSPAGTYKVGGINYSNIRELALYRARAQLRNERLTSEKNGHPVSSNLIIYKTDLSALDDRISFNFLASDEENGDVIDNAYAWMYPLVNEFINLPQFKNLDPMTDWSEDQDLNQLKEFLDKYAPTHLHKLQLNNLSDTQFNLWINSAIAAQRLVEGDDFDIPESLTEVHVAVPYTFKAPQLGLCLSHGIQQFLHARLQKEYDSKGWKFPIDPEIPLVSSVSARQLINDYKEQGRIIGLSENVGAQNELIEQGNQLNVSAAYKIYLPLDHKHQELASQVTRNRAAVLKEIKAAIEKTKNNQPVILIANDTREVKYLEEKLKKYFGALVNIGTVTGKEFGQTQQNWIKGQAGKSKTITITTASTAKDINFDTGHLDGFMTIQSGFALPRTTRNIIGQVAKNGKHGQYVAIYEEHGLVSSHSWSYESRKQRKRMLGELDVLQKKQNQVAAVERYYVEKVLGVQQVVTKLFDEWQAFLHLIYPQHEWSSLYSELLAQRDDLIQTLSEKWQECIKQSDPDKKYSNPYHRRDEQEKLQTADLDSALKKFEQLAADVWKEQRAVLQEKTKSKIEQGSVDELRCNYMASISMAEQLQLSKLALRKNKKELVREKKAHYHTALGADVNGAMLQYSDYNVEKYRADFVLSQLELLKKDIAKVMEQSTTFDALIKKQLLKLINSIKNIPKLIFILNTYASQWLPEDSFEKKYALQPIIQRLLQVYHQADLDETDDLQTLKSFYFDNVINELSDELESTLSWAVKGNRGLGYFLERSAVTTAANELLAAAGTLSVSNSNPKLRQEAIKNLYKVLMQHQAQLEDLWIFSFGHKNIRTLIKQTLAILDNLTVIGSGKESLNADFIKDCKEAALNRVMQGKFNAALSALEVDKRTLIIKNNVEWQKIKTSLSFIQNECDNVYAFTEMSYFLDKKMAELRKNHSKLVGPLSHLRGEIRTIWHEYSQNNQDLMDSSKYFELKAEKIKEKFSGLKEYDIKQVKLKAGHSGFSDYLDLIIEGQGSHPMLNGFMHYNPNLSELTQRRQEVLSQLKQMKSQLLDLQRIEQEQLPLLKSTAIKSADPEQFHECFRAQADTLIQLKAYSDGQFPDDLSGFSNSVQNDFQDRELIKHFDFKTLDAGEIAKIKDQQLQSDFMALYCKLNKEAKPLSLWSWTASYAASFIVTPETEEDRRFQFAVLKDNLNNRLREVFHQTIDQQQSVLAKQIKELQLDIRNQQKILKDKSVFINQKILEEKAKGGIYCKRFKDMAEFYEFEEQLKAFKLNLVANCDSTYSSVNNGPEELFIFCDEELEEELFYSCDSSYSI